jgi:hypothetical protein
MIQDVIKVRPKEKNCEDMEWKELDYSSAVISHLVFAVLNLGFHISETDSTLVNSKTLMQCSLLSRLFHF